jgi:hypothetical protein
MFILLTISSIIIWSIVSMRLMKPSGKTGMDVKLLFILGVVSTALLTYVLWQKLL